MATKKDEAFEFFSQGKTPNDSDVASLGLAKASVQRYYRLWRQLNQEPEVPVTVVSPVMVLSEVPLGDVADGGLFEYRGQTYKKRCKVYSGQVIVLLVYKVHYANVFQPTGESIYLSPDVMVTPR